MNQSRDPLGDILERKQAKISQDQENQKRLDAEQRKAQEDAYRIVREGLLSAANQGDFKPYKMSTDSSRKEGGINIAFIGSSVPLQIVTNSAHSIDWRNPKLLFILGGHMGRVVSGQLPCSFVNEKFTVDIEKLWHEMKRLAEEQL